MSKPNAKPTTKPTTTPACTGDTPCVDCDTLPPVQVAAPAPTPTLNTPATPQGVGVVDARAAVVVASTAARAPRRATSDVAYPVAVVWVVCFNACAAARAGAKPPTRGALFDLCYAQGVATNTIKTQVQRYLRASKGGTVRPLDQHLPRNVSLPAGA